MMTLVGLLNIPTSGPNSTPRAPHTPMHNKVTFPEGVASDERPRCERGPLRWEARKQVDSAMEWGCEGPAIPMRGCLPSIALRPDCPGPGPSLPPSLSLHPVPPSQHPCDSLDYCRPQHTWSDLERVPMLGQCHDGVLGKLRNLKGPPGRRLALLQRRRQRTWKMRLRHGTTGRALRSFRCSAPTEGGGGGVHGPCDGLRASA